MYTLLQRIFHFLFYGPLILVSLNSFLINRRILQAFDPFPLPLPHGSHGLYVLLAIKIQATLRKDESFFPNERHLPIDYKALVNPGWNEFYQNNTHRKGLPM